MPRPVCTRAADADAAALALIIMENQRFGIIWQLIKIHKLYFSVSLKNQAAIADTIAMDHHFNGRCVN